MSGLVRVLMVNYEFPPLGGGSGNATLHVLREIAGAGDVTIDLLTSGGRGSREREAFAPTITVHRIPIAKREPHYWTTRELLEWSIRAVHLSRRLATGNRYDLCHCWGGWPSGLIGHLHRARIPYVIALRGSDVPGYNPRLRLLDPFLLQPISRPVWKRAAVVTCVSTRLGELARRTQRELRYQVIRNGVDAVRFRPGPGAERPTFLFVGRLIGRKGVIDLLQAFREIAERDPDPVLLVAGGGPQGGRLRAFVRDAGLQSRVTFLGSVDATAVPDLYRRASVFVMPSVEEAMSNAALEAMASGLPVITTDTGVAEVVDGNGFVVGCRRPAELAAAMRRYLADPDLRDRHGRRSRELAESMTWSQVADAYRAVYDGILARQDRLDPVAR